MSLISEALKKLEHRPQGGPSDRIPPAQQSGDGKKRSLMRLTAVVVCLLLIAATGIYLYSKHGGKRASKPDEVNVAVAVKDAGEKVFSPQPVSRGVSKVRGVASGMGPAAGKERIKEAPAGVPSTKERDSTAIPQGGKEREGENGVRSGGVAPPSRSQVSRAFQGEKPEQVKEYGVRETYPPRSGSEEKVAKKETPPVTKADKFLITKSGAETAKERELEYFNEGVIHLEEGDLSSAERNFLFALEHNPENVDALCNLSVVSMRLGDFDSARLYVYEALKISPTHVRSLNNAGVLSLKTRRYATSLDAFEKALIYDKENPDVLANLALLYYKIGDPEKAIYYGRKSAEISPGNPEAWYNLGLVYYQRDNRYQAGHAFSKFLALADEHDLRVSPVREILEAIK